MNEFFVIGITGTFHELVVVQKGNPKPRYFLHTKPQIFPTIVFDTTYEDAISLMKKMGYIERDVTVDVLTRTIVALMGDRR